ncbi:MAG: GntR family transcriptional regulator [Salinivirgaceae bacterium]|jgi:DNA-binding transcriptional regulator YhcF (GntR family)|nr:GntR family transcriptional regulator [Salinivirgaceae bacterium]
MTVLLKIDKALNTPVYQQIFNSLLSRIEDGSFFIGSQLPSINQVAGDYNLARETVVKAFKILQEQGIISPVQGKGYFVSSLQLIVKNRIFVLFDTFSAYKEVIYNALKDSAGSDDFVDIYFHHFNFKVFEKTITESIGNYQSYIIIPIEHERLDEVLSAVPADKLYLLDTKPQNSNGNYSGIFQNFEDDIFNALTSAVELCRKYSKLILVFRNQITDPPAGIIAGFQRFCSINHFDSLVIRTSLSKRKLKSGEAYIVIDDDDLVYLVENANSSGLKLGADLGIISYNETPLKKIAANGISVISTDFTEMGTQIAQMVIKKLNAFRYNSFRFINRGSF